MVKQVVETGRRYVVAQRLEQDTGIAVRKSHLLAEVVAFDIGAAFLGIER